MNREEVLEQLYQVKELIEFLDEKEELLRTMKFIALEVLNAEIREEWFWINRFGSIVLDQSFQDLQNQFSYLESKISGSFPEVLNNSIE